jgi:hypothetical protein
MSVNDQPKRAELRRVATAQVLSDSFGFARPASGSSDTPPPASSLSPDPISS